MLPDEYRKLAQVEDQMWYFRSLHAHCLRELTRELPAAAPAQVLDGGCGTGGFLRRLAAERPAWHLTGVDVSPLACSLARERSQATILLGSLEELPFSDGEFDAVVSADVLYHVGDDRKALRELHRVLRPGGLLVVNVPAYPWLWSYHDVAVESKRRYGKAELREKLASAGFVAQRLTYLNAAPLPLVILRRKLLPAPPGGSDVALLPAPVEGGFRIVSAVERGWVGAGLALPFGSSLFGVSKRP
jgi:ubiquinone/menaquinone biosynthesis C-methylase UbiE